MAPILISDRRAGPEKQIICSVTSYMNFIISNSLIVLPSYVSENSEDKTLLKKEAEVEHLFKKVFPSREIIKVRADTINYYSGGFHCISIHEPLLIY
jgi:agmatine deiminase